MRKISLKYIYKKKLNIQISFLGTSSLMANYSIKDYTPRNDLTLLNILDHSYGRLYNPSYRDEYKKFLVPQVAWDFYIGGYQPAQKWLSDRKGRTLTFDDVTHYQKIIKVLAETYDVMKNIDRVSDIKETH